MTLQYNPLMTPEYNFEVAQGGNEFRDKVIVNLRQQIQNLRDLARVNGTPIEEIAKDQYKHNRGIE